MTDESAFLRTIIAAPDDDAPRLVYLDWLEERGERTEAKLLKYVLAGREADWPRLLMACFWEREGQPERAEFVRVQCELAAMPKLPNNCTRFHLERGYCKQCKPQKALRRREQELWSAYTFAPPMPIGFRGRLGQLENDGDCLVRRGFVESVTCSWKDWSSHADAILSSQPVREVRLTTWPAHPFVHGLSEPHLDAIRRRLSLKWPTVKTWELPAHRGQVVTITRDMILGATSDLTRLNRATL